MKWFEITDTAKAQMEGLLSKNPDKYAISLAVKGGGCAGFKYEWGFTDKNSINDCSIIETIFLIPIPSLFMSIRQ